MQIRRKSKDPVVVALNAAGLSSTEARRLAAAGTRVTVNGGVQLVREGEFGFEAFVLVSGEAIVRLPGNDRALAIGEVFGEIAALDPAMRRTATVETTKESVVLAYDIRTFRGLASDMSDVLVPDRAA